jgi:hypothetical protein
MRDDDEDDFNFRGGADSDEERNSESEGGQEDDNLSEDGRKMKEHMEDAQARISEGKSLLQYNVMVEDDEEEVK